MAKDYFSLAIKNLRKKGIRSWLTVFGIFIGIAAVVSLITLGGALRGAITGQFGALDADKLIVENSGTGFGPPGSTSIKKLEKHDVDVIESVSGIKGVVARLVRVVKVEYNKIIGFYYVGSMPDNNEELKIIYDELNADLINNGGRLWENGDRGKVVVGSDFAGDNFEKNIRIGTNIKIQEKEFKVIGIFEPTSTFTVNSIVLMSEDDLRELYNIDKNEFDTILVQVENQDEVEEVAEDIERKLRKDRNLKQDEEDFFVQTSKQSVETIDSLLRVVNLIVIAVAAISLLVGGIGIANTMYTSVLERTREIGVMKAIGAQRRDILSIFLIESGLLGLVGGIGGAIIGLLFSFLVAFGAQSAFPGLGFSVELDPMLLIFSVSFSLVTGCVFGILPALQASKLNPVEALRR